MRLSKNLKLIISFLLKVKSLKGWVGTHGRAYYMFQVREKGLEVRLLKSH